MHLAFRQRMRRHGDFGIVAYRQVRRHRNDFPRPAGMVAAGGSGQYLEMVGQQALALPGTLGEHRFTMAVRPRYLAWWWFLAAPTWVSINGSIGHGGLLKKSG